MERNLEKGPFFYFRLVGFLLFIPYASIAGILYMYSVLDRSIDRTISEKGIHTFATLKRADTSRTPRGTHYFYTYGGFWKNRGFQKQEEVGPELYFILSEGKNVEILLYEDPSGEIYTRILANNRTTAKDLTLLKHFAEALAGVGVIMLLLSLPLNRRRRKRSSSYAGQSIET